VIAAQWSSFFSSPVDVLTEWGNYLRHVRFLRHLLWPVALFYGAAVWLRNVLFDEGVLRSLEFDVPIISVGNLEMGGTGKSPLVLHICRYLSEQGLHVAMLSRGYGRTSKGFRSVEVTSLASDVGDEPLQAKLQLPHIMVAVCENRATGIRQLMANEHPPQVIVLDDAFQHRWVRPRLSILTTPAARPFWENHLFPVGNLREWVSGAMRAQVLVLTGSGSGCEARGFKGTIFHVRTVADDPQPLLGTGALRAGDRVFLLSGIASPERFRETAAQLYQVVGHRILPDHHVFTERDILALREAFHSFDPPPQAVLITQKDAARLRSRNQDPLLIGMPIFILPVRLEWEKGSDKEFNRIIDHHAGAD
jgi:tetraacyldisaccharide 4'-kinase